MTYDHLARADYKKSPASAVWWLIISAYLYYIRDYSLLTDETFDKMAKVILEKKIKHSKLSHLFTDEDLAAGSLFKIKPTEYPDFIREAGERILRGVETYAIKTTQQDSIL